MLDENKRFSALWKPAGDELAKRNERMVKVHQINTTYDNQALQEEEPEEKEPIDWVLWIVGGILAVIGLGVMFTGAGVRDNTLVVCGVAVIILAIGFAVCWIMRPVPREC